MKKQLSLDKIILKECEDKENNEYDDENDDENDENEDENDENDEDENDEDENDDDNLTEMDPFTELNELNDGKAPMKIKEPNEVYYEMYKKARLEAKLAKQKAQHAYLEAKHIKDLHLLDISDSDSDNDIIN